MPDVYRHVVPLSMHVTYWDYLGLAGAIHGLAINGTTSFTAINAPNRAEPAISRESISCEGAVGSGAPSTATSA